MLPVSPRRRLVAVALYDATPHSVSLVAVSRRLITINAAKVGSFK